MSNSLRVFGRALVVVLGIVLSLLLGGSAGAQKRPHTWHYEQGRIFYEQKDYKASAEAFEEAYRLKKVSAYLPQMARSYAEQGNYDKAISYYELYLMDLNAADRKVVQVALQEAKKKRDAIVAEQARLQWERDQIAKREKEEADAAKRAAEEAKRRADRERQEAIDRMNQAEKEVAQQRRKRGLVIGLSVAGSALAVIGITTAVSLVVTDPLYKVESRAFVF